MTREYYNKSFLTPNIIGQIKLAQKLGMPLTPREKYYYWKSLSTMRGRKYYASDERQENTQIPEDFFQMENIHQEQANALVNESIPPLQQLGQPQPQTNLVNDNPPIPPLSQIHQTAFQQNIFSNSQEFPKYVVVCVFYAFPVGSNLLKDAVEYPICFGIKSSDAFFFDNMFAFCPISIIKQFFQDTFNNFFRLHIIDFFLKYQCNARWGQSSIKIFDYQTGLVIFPNPMNPDFFCNLDSSGKHNLNSSQHIYEIPVGGFNVKSWGVNSNQSKYSTAFTVVKKTGEQIPGQTLPFVPFSNCTPEFQQHFNFVLTNPAPLPLRSHTSSMEQHLNTWKTHLEQNFPGVNYPERNFSIPDMIEIFPLNGVGLNFRLKKKSSSVVFTPISSLRFYAEFSAKQAKTLKGINFSSNQQVSDQGMSVNSQQFQATLAIPLAGQTTSGNSQQVQPTVSLANQVAQTNKIPVKQVQGAVNQKVLEATARLEISAQAERQALDAKQKLVHDQQESLSQINNSTNNEIREVSVQHIMDVAKKIQEASQNYQVLKEARLEAEQSLQQAQLEAEQNLQQAQLEAEQNLQQAQLD